MNPDTVVGRHLWVTGRVQGVFYRASTVDQARRLGVQGWVRNRRDGSVEVVAQGAPQAVQALIDWARRGPVRARVDSVQIREVPTESFTGFEQRETA